MKYSPLKLRKQLVSPMLFCWLLSASAQAEVLIANFTELINHSESQAEIEAALRATNLNIKFVTSPNQRGLRRVEAGEYAIDVFRQPSSVSDIGSLIQLQPAVATRHHYLVARSKALCDLDDEKRAKLSVVGVRGASIFPEQVYPLFKTHHEASSFDQVIQMLHRGRGEFSVWTKSSISISEANTGLSVHICSSTPLASITFFSYVHTDFAWAIPQIEKAYRSQFLKASP